MASRKFSQVNRAPITPSSINSVKPGNAMDTTNWPAQERVQQLLADLAMLNSLVEDGILKATDDEAAEMYANIVEIGDMLAEIARFLDRYGQR